MSSTKVRHVLAALGVHQLWDVWGVVGPFAALNPKHPIDWALLVELRMWLKSVGGQVRLCEQWHTAEAM